MPTSVDHGGHHQTVDRIDYQFPSGCSTKCYVPKDNSKKPVALSIAMEVAVETGSGKAHRPLNGFRLRFPSCR